MKTDPETSPVSSCSSTLEKGDEEVVITSRMIRVYSWAESQQEYVSYWNSQYHISQTGALDGVHCNITKQKKEKKKI